MNRISIEKFTIIGWLTALLFLSLIPVNKYDRFQDNKENGTTVSMSIHQTNALSFFDVEETEDILNHHFAETHSFQDCHFREFDAENPDKKLITHNRTQIDITFFNLPPPLQNS